MRDIARLIASIAICFVAGGVAGLATETGPGTWYATLEQPAFAPPDWLFSPVWITLYLLMGIALFLVWRQGWSRPEVRLAMAAFSVQLVLNSLWSFAFFQLESPAFGAIGLALLLAAIGWTIYRFMLVHRLAAALLVPYVLWVTFALALNVGIWVLNPAA
jgi:translocator protein